MSMLFDLINADDSVATTPEKVLDDISVAYRPESQSSSISNFAGNVGAAISKKGSNTPMWSSSSPVAHVNATDAAKKAMSYYTAKGYDKKVAAGVVGNLFQESRLNTNAVGDGGTSGGVAQWHGARWNGLKRYAQRQGKDWNDLNTQLDYAVTEMPDVIDNMKKAPNARAASRIFTNQFERPNPNLARYDVREGMADQLERMAFGGKPKVRYGKQPKLAPGGVAPIVTTTANDAPNVGKMAAIGSGLSFLGDVTDSFNTSPRYSDPKLSTVSGALKGAGTGAAIGTAILPGVGTAIGAGIGAIAGAFSGNAKAKKEKKQYESQQALQSVAFMDGARNRTDSILQTYPTNGIRRNQYRYGAKLK